MLPLMIGSSLASGFGLLTGAVYGPDTLFHGAWTFLTLWGLLAGPAMMAAAALDPAEAPVPVRLRRHRL